MSLLTKWIPAKSRVEELLTRSHNRRLIRNHVDRLAIAMAAGAWNPVVAPILFYRDGTLADGQHRLAAWLQAGAPDGVWFLSAVIEQEEIVKVDAGRLRSTRDHCAIMRIPLDNRAIAAARWALNLELDKTYDAGPLVATHEMLIEAAWRFNITRFAHRMLPASVAGTLAYIGEARGVSPFFDLVVHGENLTRNHPAYHLRTLCLNSSFANRNLRSEWSIKTVRAWNAYATGESMGVLKAPARPWSWIEIEERSATDGTTSPQ
jgi:hypothetical protein